MSSTIFCTFDQQDLADLAMGRLRSEFHGINHISYSTQPVQTRPTVENSAGDFSGLIAGNSLQQTDTIRVPSRPATVRISCDDSIRDQVASRLVNLHAYRIINA